MPGLSDSSLLLPQGPTGYYCKADFLGQCPTSRDPIYTFKALESACCLTVTQILAS